MNLKRIFSLWKDDEGAAATEFALVTPFLLVILYGNMFFHELILMKYHVIKCSRYVAFELTCRPSTDVATFVSEFALDHRISTDQTVFEVEGFENANSIFDVGSAGGIRPDGVQNIAYTILLALPSLCYKGVLGAGGYIDTSAALGDTFSIGILTGYFDGESRENGARGVDFANVTKDLMIGQVRGDYVPRWAALPLLFGESKTEHSDFVDKGDHSGSGYYTSDSATVSVCGSGGDSYGRFAILVNDWKASGGNVINSDDVGQQWSMKARVTRVFAASVFDGSIYSVISSIQGITKYVGLKFLDFKDVVDIDTLGKQNLGTANMPPVPGEETGNDGDRITNNTWRLKEFR